MNMLATINLSQDHDFPGSLAAAQPGIVLVVSDNPATRERLRPVCEFLELRMKVVSGGMDLLRVLEEHAPMAVITDVEGEYQDGFHVMKTVARFNRELPIMLLTDGDPMLMGAADAVQDLCALTAVTSTSGFPVAGQLVAFLFGAGRRAGCMRLVPV